MKTTILTLATALLVLTSCKKEELVYVQPNCGDLLASIVWSYDRHSPNPDTAVYYSFYLVDKDRPNINIYHDTISFKLTSHDWFLINFYTGTSFNTTMKDHVLWSKFPSLRNDGYYCIDELQEIIRNAR